MNTILKLIMVVEFCIIFAGLLQTTMKKVNTVLYVYFLLFIVTTYEWVASTTLRFSLLGFSLNFTDIICLYLIATLSLYKCTHKLQNKYSSTVKGMLCIMTCIFIVSLFRGVTSYSFTNIMEDIRRLLNQWIVPLICMMYLPIDISDVKVQKLLKHFVHIVIIYCFFCWFLDIGLGMPIMKAQSDAGTTMRVLRPEQAAELAMISIYMLYKDLYIIRKRYVSTMTILLIVVVILLQHRSAWAALAAGIVALFLFNLFFHIENPHKSKLNKNSLTVNTKLLYELIVFAVMIPIILVAMHGTSLMQELQMGLGGFTSDSGTLAYRQQLWSASLGSLSSFQWAVGKPFGSGYVVDLENYSRTITPHNTYIHSILRIGIIGVVVVILFIIAVMLNCIKKRQGFTFAVCVTLLVFWVSYSYNFHNAFILGLALNMITKQTHKQPVKLNEYEINTGGNNT